MKALCLIGILTIFFPVKIMNYEPPAAEPKPVIEAAAEDVYSEPEQVEDTVNELDEEPGCSCFDEGMQYGIYSDNINDIPEEVWDIINQLEE